MFTECQVLMLTESIIAMLSFKTFHVMQLSHSISCMSILMYGWDILLVFVLFFGLCSSCKGSQSADDWLKTVFDLPSQQKVLHINGWWNQSWLVSNIIAPTLSQQKQSGRTSRWWQKYWHQNAFTASVKRYLTMVMQMIIVGIVLVVSIENSRNRCEMNYCGNRKQRLNELMRVDIATSTLQ